MTKCKVCGYTYAGDACPACGFRPAEEPPAPTAPAPQPGQQPGEKPAAPAKGIHRNPLFTKYADFFDNEALYQLGCCIAEGINTERNEEQAAEIFQILAFRGHYGGMYKLAEHFLSLDPPDTESALQWLRIAADGGHEPSKLRLRILGEGAAKRPVIAGPIEKLPEGSFQARVRNALPCIVMVYSTCTQGGRRIGSCGSGFILEGGYVVTNAHVVGENPSSVSASFEPSIDEKSYNLMPLAIAPEYDVAVLRFTGLMDERISARENLRLRLDNVEYGEEVYTIGNPLGLRFSVSRGVVSSPCRQGGHRSGIHEVIQTDITANHGNSGGALLDASNNVLGMITYTPGDSEGGITMCVPSKYIVLVLNKLGQAGK